jgi:hypothetical protein
MLIDHAEPTTAAYPRVPEPTRSGFVLDWQGLFYGKSGINVKATQIHAESANLVCLARQSDLQHHVLGNLCYR